MSNVYFNHILITTIFKTSLKLYIPIHLKSRKFLNLNYSSISEMVLDEKQLFNISYKS